jgi:hypothetical protein
MEYIAEIKSVDNKKAEPFLTLPSDIAIFSAGVQEA